MLVSRSPGGVQVVGDVQRVQPQPCGCLVGQIQAEIELPDGPSLPHLPLQQAGDVEQQADCEGRQDVEEYPGQAEHGGNL